MSWIPVFSQNLCCEGIHVCSEQLPFSQSPREMLRNQAASYQFVCLPGLQPCSESYSYSGNPAINHSSSCPVIQPVRYLFIHFVSITVSATLFSTVTIKLPLMRITVICLFNFLDFIALDQLYRAC